ncbi:MAG: hypothetical protein QM594_17560 [Niabella sp.]
MIIAATLITVATIDSLMINLEKDRFLLNAMRVAMKDDRLIS